LQAHDSGTLGIQVSANGRFLFTSGADKGQAGKGVKVWGLSRHEKGGKTSLVARLLQTKYSAYSDLII